MTSRAFEWSLSFLLALVAFGCGSTHDEGPELFDSPEGTTSGAGTDPSPVPAVSSSADGSASTTSGTTGSSLSSGTTSGSGSGGASANASASASSGSGSGSGLDSGNSTGDPRESFSVPGGKFAMGRSTNGDDACPSDLQCLAAELPEHTVEVEGFLLDRTEVTVAEFRDFASGFGGAPTPGAGAHPRNPNSGWRVEYDVELPGDARALGSLLSSCEDATYTAEPGPNEALPINCVSWYEAMAFCISRGGRLPSEAEWEFAAAGGEQNRLYPWGDAAPSPSLAAVYPSELAEVGAFEEGRGRWGHADLSGNLWEWVLDWLDPSFYEAIGDECVDCVSAAAGTHRGLRGGAYTFDAGAARAAARSGEVPNDRKRSIGFRCAYDD